MFSKMMNNSLAKLRGRLKQLPYQIAKEASRLNLYFKQAHLLGLLVFVN